MTRTNASARAAGARFERTPQPGIPARFETDCPRCDQPIHKGDRIAFSKGRPIHCACASGGEE